MSLSSWLRKVKLIEQLWGSIVLPLSRRVPSRLGVLENQTGPATAEIALGTFWLIGVLLASGIALTLADALTTWQLARAECLAGRAEDRQQRDLLETQLYTHEVERLAKEVASRQTTLPAAAAALAGYLEQRRYDPLTILRSRFAGLSDEGCLAIVLLRYVAASFQDQPEAGKEILTACVREFEEHYGVALPPHAWGEDSGRRG